MTWTAGSARQRQHVRMFPIVTQSTGGMVAINEPSAARFGADQQTPVALKREQCGYSSGDPNVCVFI